MIIKTSKQKIIQGCCGKQPKYQRLMVERYAGFLFAICLRYMNNKEDAKDQLQKSLFKILDKIGSYDVDKASFESWISTIAINTCLSELKKNRIDTVPIIPEYNDLQFVNPDIIDRLDTQELLKVVKSLPDKYREVFNLIEIDGYSHKEVAKMIGIKESSSRSRLTRSKQLLREKLVSLKKNESWKNLA